MNAMTAQLPALFRFMQRWKTEKKDKA